MLCSNMGSELTFSLGGPLRPPHGSHRIRYPMGGRDKIKFVSSFNQEVPINQLSLSKCVDIVNLLKLIPSFYLGSLKCDSSNILLNKHRINLSKQNRAHPIN